MPEVENVDVNLSCFQHSASIEDFRLQIAKQEEDFKRLHNEQSEVYKLIRADLQQMMESVKTPGKFTASEPQIVTQIVEEVLQTKDLQMIQQELGEVASLRAKLAELEPTTHQIQNLQQTSTVQSSSLADIHHRLHEIEEHLAAYPLSMLSHTPLPPHFNERMHSIESVLHALEDRSHADSARVDRRIGDMLARMEMLEDTLRNEQETSLKALEAILAE